MVMDFENATLKAQDIENLNLLNKKSNKKLNKKKISTTIYLTEEAEHAFIELYIHRLRKDRKIDKSAIACQAILELYEKECKNSG